jgi:hypothetical protein
VLVPAAQEVVRTAAGEILPLPVFPIGDLGYCNIIRGLLKIQRFV